MACERRLILVLEGHRDLPIAHIAVQHGEHGGLSQEVYAVVHPGKGVGVFDRHVIEAPLVHAEPRSAVGFWNDDDREGPLGLWGIDDSQFKLFGQLFRDQLPMV